MLSNGSGDVFIWRAPDYLIPEDQSVVPFQPMSQDGFFILSPYNCSFEKAMEDSIVTDFTDSARDFSPGVWILALITVIVFSMLISTHSTIYGYRADSGIWTLINHSLFNPSYRVAGNVSKLISSLILFFVFFFIVSYLKNIVKTDQVRMKEQKVYRSFRDIVNEIEGGTNLTIMFTSQGRFKSIFDEPLYNDVMKSLKYYVHHGNGREYDKMDSIVESLLNPNHIVIEAKVSALIIKRKGCKMAASKSLCLYQRQETGDNYPTINEIMASKKFLSRYVASKLHSRIARSFEAGLKIEFLMSRDINISDFRVSSLDCLSELVHTKMYDPEHNSMSIFYFIQCIKSMIFLVLLALISLITEHAWEARKILYEKLGKYFIRKRRKKIHVTVFHVRMRDSNTE